MASVSIAVIIGIILVLAAVIVGVSLVLYNRHLDKVARGEEHDTHSPLPEPGATVGATYKVVLIVLLIIALIAISTIKGKINTMQSNIVNLQSELNSISTQLNIIRDQMEKADKLVSNESYDIISCDLESHTAEVKYSAVLKQYSDSTKVYLVLNGNRFELTKDASGAFSGTVRADLFDTFPEPVLHIEENGKTSVDSADFPGTLFWDYLPMPVFDSRFDTEYKNGKYIYSGSLNPIMSNTGQIASVQLSYITGDKVLKTVDITKQVISQEQIDIEEGLKIENDLAFEIEITTKDGLRIVERNTMIYETSDDFMDHDFQRIYDKDGSLLWDNMKYQ